MPNTIENLQSLITVANQTTGKADTDLTAGVQSLIAGFGGDIEPLIVTQNGIYDSEEVDGYKPVKVNCPVPKVEQEKTIEIKENGTVTITPDIGKVLAKVVANVNCPSGVDISPFTEILQGEFTLARDSRGFGVAGTEGKLGNKNSYFLCYRADLRVEKGYEIYNLITPYRSKYGGGWIGQELAAGINYDGSKAITTGSSGNFPVRGNEKVTLSTPLGSINFQAGVTYKWVYVR